MKYPTHLIEAPKKDDKVTYDDGDTNDIIATILEADKKAAEYTQKFAPQLKGLTLIDTCKNIWEFVKNEIPYKLDPEGEQWIKSPGRLWADKSGDCKSFSIFTASILQNLKIGYGYRFTSFHPTDSTPTHVYVYVPIKGDKEIILDSVWSGPFNSQKQFTFKKDILMSKISYLGSVDSNSPLGVGSGILNIGDGSLSQGELDLLLAKQKIEIDAANAASISGFKNGGYQKSLKVINHCLQNVHDPACIDGVGNHLISVGQTKAGKFLKKAATTIKKGTKAVTKVATAPFRLMAKGILEIYLPKAAIFFLYLFASETILPDKMKAQRKKADKLKTFIVQKIGMKDAHFMAIIRNNLTKRFKRSPEVFLSEKIKNSNEVKISGIGKVPVKKKLPKKHPVQKAKVNPQKKLVVPAFITKGREVLQTLSINPTEILQNAANNLPSSPNKVADKTVRNQKILNTVSKAADLANLIPGGPGAIISAILTVIAKLGGRKEDFNITADDIPNPDADNANAFQYSDLQNDYSNLNGSQKATVKEVVTNLIQNDVNTEYASETLDRQLSFLSPPQKDEMLQEIEEGFEPPSESEDDITARLIRLEANQENNQYNNGGGSRGWCS